MHTAGDFNLNLQDHNTNRKVHNFLSLIYQNGMIPTINKPTRVTRKTATSIDHILTNSFVDTVFKTVIFKSDISDHFPICFLSQNSLPKQNNKENMFIYNIEHIILNLLNYLKRSCMKQNRMKSCPFKTQMMPIKPS